ncbi:MAG TPA: hypothetical protein VJA25_01405 [Dehalococcoidia bacterium]|nr:hypothetical protein [Dehalococcoidia bacterium]
MASFVGRLNVLHRPAKLLTHRPAKAQRVRVAPPEWQQVLVYGSSAQIENVPLRELSAHLPIEARWLYTNRAAPWRGAVLGLVVLAFLAYGLWHQLGMSPIAAGILGAPFGILGAIIGWFIGQQAEEAHIWIVRRTTDGLEVVRHSSLSRRELFHGKEGAFEPTPVFRSSLLAEGGKMEAVQRWIRTKATSGWTKLGVGALVGCVIALAIIWFLMYAVQSDQAAGGSTSQQQGQGIPAPRK